MTFIVGVTSAALLAARYGSQPTIPAVNLSDTEQPNTRSAAREIPTVTLCELARNPDAYGGKTIRVRAILVADKTRLWTHLVDRTCGEQPVWMEAWCDEFSRANCYFRVNWSLNRFLGSRTSNKPIVAEVELDGEFVPKGEWPLGHRIFMQDVRAAQLLDIKLKPPPRPKRNGAC